MLRTKKVGDNKVIQVLIVNLCLENTLLHLSLLMALLLTPAASTADIVILWF